jgi:hypothetical protein
MIKLKCYDIMPKEGVLVATVSHDGTILKAHGTKAEGVLSLLKGGKQTISEQELREAADRYTGSRFVIVIEE